MPYHSWACLQSSLQPQFPYWGGYSGGPGRTGGFCDSGAGPVVKCNIFTVNPYTPGAPGSIHCPISQPATGISIASTCVCGKRQYWPSQPLTVQTVSCVYVYTVRKLVLGIRPPLGMVAHWPLGLHHLCRVFCMYNASGRGQKYAASVPEACH